MPKYTDEDIRNMSKITCKIAADYLGISPMAVSIGMRNDLLPIGFAIHNEERDRTYSESWSYHIIGERLIAYKYGKTSEVQVQNIEKSLNTIYRTVWRNEKRFGFSIKRKRGSAELELYEYAFSLGKYKDVDKKYAGKELPGWRMKKE